MSWMCCDSVVITVCDSEREISDSSSAAEEPQIYFYDANAKRRRQPAKCGTQKHFHLLPLDVWVHTTRSLNDGNTTSCCYGNYYICRKC